MSAKLKSEEKKEEESVSSSPTSQQVMRLIDQLTDFSDLLIFIAFLFTHKATFILPVIVTTLQTTVLTFLPFLSCRLE